MISRPSVRLAAVLLICYLCIALPRSCHAEQQPSLRGSVWGTALGDAQDFNNVTLLDSQTLRRRDAQETNNTLFIAGLFNTSTYDWTEIFNFTMTLIQERNGWHDDILGDDNNTRLEWAMADSACDEDTALQAYWDLTTSHVVHGVVGTRCSDDSILIARIAGLESTPQISPSATSPTLSDKVSTTCRMVMYCLLSCQIGSSNLF
jgi:Receptor family ligand binding region